MSRITQVWDDSQKFKDMMSSEELEEWRKERILERVSETSALIVDDLNASGSKNLVVDGMLQGIIKSHRYLQGEFWMAMSQLCKKYSELDDRYFDERNRFAKDLAKRMAEGAENI